MSKIPYEQVRSDHEYLWDIAPAHDMTGGYVDQEDLRLMLRTPTKSMASKCYLSQIEYWFQAGPDRTGDAMHDIPWQDERVREIAERYAIDVPGDQS
ncbi:hypothetical protein IFT84_17685 [Rhizobium sp. CFBP 8762]|uniref:hypothetical protein n=1 Tax=Rhizobium sp. CFBP 8762 TaxID=2775279 RepID=UPI001781E5A7|nr:hypothetical protein [Rhizobium sp. CFBP 8762]MBD8556343.1 hypothetical protein [Rhizobium sp. CFBP 8762]